MTTGPVCLAPQQDYVSVRYDAESDSFVFEQPNEYESEGATIVVRGGNIDGFIESLSEFRSLHPKAGEGA